jgi:hypothetical protein
MRRLCRYKDFVSQGIVLNQIFTIISYTFSSKRGVFPMAETSRTGFDPSAPPFEQMDPPSYPEAIRANPEVRPARPVAQDAQGKTRTHRINGVAAAILLVALPFVALSIYVTSFWTILGITVGLGLLTKQNPKLQDCVISGLALGRIIAGVRLIAEGSTAAGLFNIAVFSRIFLA